MLAHRYIATRLALVGDAAHGVHPIAGQGLNLGFRDVAVLGDLVMEALRQGEDPGSPGLLRRYQAARRPDNLLMLAGDRRAGPAVQQRILPVRVARDLGIAAVNRVPALKRLFMRYAMGSLMA